MYDPNGRINGVHGDRGISDLVDRLCYIDMDGVLTDLIKAICARHNVPNPYAYGENVGVWNTASLLGMSNAQFWSVTENHDFWTNLPKTRWADEIVNRAIKAYGVDGLRICSSPTLSHHSYSGKAAWIRKWYPKLARSVWLAGGPGKFELAKPGRMLLDDKPEAVFDWVGAGGCGIIIPADWNGVSEGNIALI